MSQQQEITALDQVSDAQRSRSRARLEHCAPLPEQPAQAVPQAAQAAQAADAVSMSEEARQAVQGRSCHDVQDVTALKDALRAMMHERPPVAAPQAAWGSRVRDFLQSQTA